METVTEMALPAGTVLDRYHIEQVIHQGSFVIQYLARDNQGQQVWIKELFPAEFAHREGLEARANDPSDRNALRWWLRSYLDEATTLAKVRHPALLPVIGAFEANGTAYAVYSVVAGEPFSARLEKQRTLPEPEIRKILGPVLGALQAVHAVNVLHRDLRPETILITPQGQPLLIDFGVLRAPLRLKSRTLFSVSQSPYAAPEEGHAAGQHGPWTDLYALSAIAYRSITGEVPVEAGLRSRGVAQPSVEQKATVRASEALLSAIDWGLKLTAADRPQSVDEWRKVLQAEEVLPDSSLTRQASLAPTARTLPRGTLLAAVGAVLLGGGVYWALAANSAMKPLPQVAAATSAPAPAGTLAGNAEAANSLDATAQNAAANSDAQTANGSSSLSQLEQLAAQQMIRERQQAQDAQKNLARELAQRNSASQNISATVPAKASDAAQVSDVKILPAAADPKSTIPTTLASVAPASADAEAIAARNRQLEQELARLKQEQEAQQRKQQEDQMARDQAAQRAVEQAKMDEDRQKAVIARARAQCSIPAPDLSENGNLTYETAMRVREAVKLSNGSVRLPPVTLPNGRTAQFDITPDSCARRVME